MISHVGTDLSLSLDLVLAFCLAGGLLLFLSLYLK